jgi:hypothetical protein
MGSCLAEDKSCDNQLTHIRLIDRRLSSLVVPEPQSLIEKSRNRQKRHDTY